MAIDADFRLRQGAFAEHPRSPRTSARSTASSTSTQGDGPGARRRRDAGAEPTDQPVDLDLAVSTLDPETREEVGAAARRARRRRLAGAAPTSARRFRHSAAALGETAEPARRGDRRPARRWSRSSSRAATVVGALADEPATTSAQTAERAGHRCSTIAAGRQAELRAHRRRARARPRGARARRSTGSSRPSPNLRELVAAARPAGRRAGARPRARPAPGDRGPAPAAGRGAGGSRAPLARAAASARSRCSRRRCPVAGRLPPVLDWLTPLLDHLRARGPEVVGFFTALRRRDLELRRQRQPGPRLAAARSRSTATRTRSAPPSDAAGLASSGPFDRNPGSARGRAVGATTGARFIGGGKPPRSYLDERGAGAVNDADGAPGRDRHRRAARWSRCAAVCVTSHPAADAGPRCKAEFEDVYPLLPGMHVRVDGAIAGLGAANRAHRRRHGAGHDGADRGHRRRRAADATAAIRQQDITGDSYVALELGRRHRAARRRGDRRSRARSSRRASTTS